jgi:hypothetical protein
MGLLVNGYRVEDIVAISWGGVVDLRIGYSKGGRVGYRVQEVASK